MTLNRRSQQNSYILYTNLYRMLWRLYNDYSYVIFDYLRKIFHLQWLYYNL